MIFSSTKSCNLIGQNNFDDVVIFIFSFFERIVALALWTNVIIFTFSVDLHHSAKSNSILWSPSVAVCHVYYFVIIIDHVKDRLEFFVDISIIKIGFAVFADSSQVRLMETHCGYVYELLIIKYLILSEQSRA